MNNQAGELLHQELFGYPPEVANIRKSPEDLGYIALTTAEIRPLLTKKQFIELEAASLGLSAAEAAKSRWVTEQVVKGHRSNILKKFEARTMAQAVRAAIEQNLLE